MAVSPLDFCPTATIFLSGCDRQNGGLAGLFELAVNWVQNRLQHQLIRWFSWRGGLVAKLGRMDHGTDCV
jgi:hypothetical protein